MPFRVVGVHSIIRFFLLCARVFILQQVSPRRALMLRAADQGCFLRSRQQYLFTPIDAALVIPIPDKNASNPVRGEPVEPHAPFDIRANGWGKPIVDVSILNWSQRVAYTFFHLLPPVKNDRYTRSKKCGPSPETISKGNCGSTGSPRTAKVNSIGVSRITQWMICKHPETA